MRRPGFPGCPSRGRAVIFAPGSKQPARVRVQRVGRTTAANHPRSTQTTRQTACRMPVFSARSARMSRYQEAGIVKLLTDVERNDWLVLNDKYANAHDLTSASQSTSRRRP